MSEPLHVKFGSKKSYLILLIFIGFQSFITLNGVVEPTGKRMDFQVLKRMDHWSSPSIFIGVFYGEHVVRIESSERLRNRGGVWC